jgi:hypothetical protein
MQPENDQSIYRYMELFELYELVVNHKLKFTKLRLMDDKNEGLGDVLKLQSGSWGWQLRNQQQRLKEAYESQRESTYISCWTPIADSMAMWLLYSKNHSGFRIKTSESKLRAALKADENNNYLGHSSLPEGALVPIMHEFGPVVYVNFKTIHERSRQKLQAHDQNLKNAYLRGDEGKEELEALLKDWDAGQIDELKHPGQLKDEAYNHENEFRASFSLRVRNKMTLEEYRGLPDSISKVLGNPMLDVATRENSPSVVHLAVSPDFIEEICFDARMPHFQQATIRQILGRVDLSYVTTKAFGCLIDERDLTIREL